MTTSETEHSAVLSLNSIDYLSKQIMNFSECQNSCNKTNFQYPSTNSRLYIHTRRIGCNEKTTSPSCKSYTEIAATITPRHVAGNVAQTGHFRMQKGSITLLRRICPTIWPTATTNVTPCISSHESSKPHATQHNSKRTKLNARISSRCIKTITALK